jgi:hypothetical protein
MCQWGYLRYLPLWDSRNEEEVVRELLTPLTEFYAKTENKLKDQL